MANQCTEPRQPGDTRYVYGETCTWHAPIKEAATRRGGVPCCPHCNSDLLQLPTDTEFWSVVRHMAQSRPGYELVMRWSQGRCFPDFDTQESAYRQAMEGQS